MFLIVLINCIIRDQLLTLELHHIVGLKGRCVTTWQFVSALHFQASIDGHQISRLNCDYFTLDTAFSKPSVVTDSQGPPIYLCSGTTPTQTVYLHSQGWLIPVKYILTQSRNTYPVVKNLADNYWKKSTSGKRKWRTEIKKGREHSACLYF